MAVPKTMKALVTEKKGVATVQEIPVPTIDADEILVRVVCVALNPTDWKCASASALSRNSVWVADLARRH